MLVSYCCIARGYKLSRFKWHTFLISQFLWVILAGSSVQGLIGLQSKCGLGLGSPLKLTVPALPSS